MPNNALNVFAKILNFSMLESKYVMFILIPSLFPIYPENCISTSAYAAIWWKHINTLFKSVKCCVEFNVHLYRLNKTKGPQAMLVYRRQ